MQGAGVEWQDFNLPIPNYIEYTNNGYYIGWHIDGYFGTKKGIAYLNDTIGRVLITFKDNTPHRLPYKPDLKTADHYYPKIRKLSSLSNLQSSPSRAKAPARADNYADYAFWAIKLYTEDRIREFGEGTPVPYNNIEDWAFSQFEGKERSTIRAKCRSVWGWYETKGWELGKEKRKFKMTRRERAISNSIKIAEEAQRKIINATTGKMAQEYKKTNGKWNISKLAKELGMSRNTITKYLNT
jgi:hypothetical protein